MIRLAILALFSLFIATPSLAASGRLPVFLNEDSPLALRVLTRPVAKLYSDNKGTQVINSNLRTFQPFFVYNRPNEQELASGNAWYEVGSDEQGSIVGWLKAEDVFEWKQTMCLAFTHPQGRNRVLFFDSKEYLESIIKSKTSDRAFLAKKLDNDIRLAASQQNPLPKNFPIISVEPDGYVDINKEFYLLPILEHQSIRLDNREGRLLKIAAATASGNNARESSDLRTNNAALKESTGISSNQQAKLNNLMIDLVWVIDTTRSMRPWIDGTAKIIHNASQELANMPNLSNRIAFGVWGYRDSLDIKDIGYLTKNFTPDLQPIDKFLPSLAKVEETLTDSMDVQEDVFAAVNDAILATRWRPGAVRIIILVADAPAHELGHRWNSSKMSEETLRTLANENKVTLGVLHLLPPRTEKFNAIAKKQFMILSTNKGTEVPLYSALSTANPNEFERVAKTLVKRIFDIASSPATILKTEASPLTGETMATMANKGEMTIDENTAISNALRAAMVTWLGSASNLQAPRDIQAWVIDKDLTNTHRQSLDVRLLLTRNQLDDLRNILGSILEAGRTAQTSGIDFFAALQSVPAMASRNPENLAKAENLAKSGTIPAFLDNLPYHSLIMAMNSQAWRDMSSDEQNSFLENLESKIASYQSIYDNIDAWVALLPNDTPDKMVCAIPMDLLP